MREKVQIKEIISTPINNLYTVCLLQIILQSH